MADLSYRDRGTIEEDQEQIRGVNSKGSQAPEPGPHADIAPDDLFRPRGWADCPGTSVVVLEGSAGGCLGNTGTERDKRRRFRRCVRLGLPVMERHGLVIFWVTQRGVGLTGG